MSGWAGALRAATRDARKTPSRTALVVLLIALPVTVITAGDTLIRTNAVSVLESLPQRIGTADALLRSDSGTGAVVQDPELSTTSSSSGGEPPLTQAQTLAQLPAGSRVVPLAEGDGTVPYPGGVVGAKLREVNLQDPLTTGLVTLVRGHLPQAPGEVVVSQRLAARGFTVGKPLAVNGLPESVVGLIDVSPDLYGRDPAVIVGPPGSLHLPTVRTWLTHVPGGVPWTLVRRLNRHGLFALSREVVRHPPPSWQVVDNSNRQRVQTIRAAVAALVCLQLVLLAAPAFAVGARRQRRVLALIAATGGAPKHIRRFVLAQGVVLGSAGALGGAALGIGAGIALTPLLPDRGRFSGPLEIPWRDIALTCAVGAGSAVLAALVPALVAGRQDVLAGLTGRRGTTGRSLRSFGWGVALITIGLVGCVQAAGPASGPNSIVFAAVPTVLGAALLAPSALGLVSRRVDGLPFALRYAVRDAARSRGRTAAAAAAVTATVAGAIALGIGGASDELQARSTYRANGPTGAAVVNFGNATPEQVRGIRTAVSSRLPGNPVTAISGTVLAGDQTAEVLDPSGKRLLGTYTNILGQGPLVGVEALSLLVLTPAQTAAATAALDTGAVVAFTDGVPTTGPVTVTITAFHGQPAPSSWTGPVLRIPMTRTLAPGQAVLSPTVAAKLGLPVRPAGLLVRGPVSRAAEDRVQEELTGIGRGNVHVERGYDGSAKRTGLLVLAAAAAVLVLGATVSAALLALSDAKPDFATLMSVGASPRVRRKVAAAYAAVIGALGATLGAAAGFVPGIAVSYPLTSNTYDGHGPSHYLAIPWTLVGLLTVGVPVLAAAGAALLTRSRLPLATRLDD